MQEENPGRARLIEEAKRHLEDGVLSQAQEQLRAAVEANDRGGRYAVLQRVYEIVTPRILEAEAGRRGWWISPYFLDWDLLFTPIERDAWHSLRARGVRLYPQYPVAGVFLDFGNPALRIGLELDGAAYHDAKQDAARDGRLAKLGWRIFRAPGREAVKGGLCTTAVAEVASDEAWTKLAEWANGTSDGLIWAIGEVFFGKRVGPIGTRDGQLSSEVLTRLAYRVLDCHRLAAFDLPDLDPEDD